MPGQDVALGELVLTPERANAIVKENAGQLDLIASHLALIDIDLKLGSQLAGAVNLSDAKRRFLRVHGCLRQALRDESFRDYDVVLIDCPPNFGLVTKTAIDPRFTGVAFTMTQIQSGQPIIAQRMQIEEVQAAIDAPVFAVSIRNSPRYFADAGRVGVPAI